MTIAENPNLRFHQLHENEGYARSDSILQRLDILVVATHRRAPLITKHLDGIPHVVHNTTEYDDYKTLAASWPFDWMNNHTAPSYWCFRGHQDVLRKMTKPYALVFEDDAVPNRADWLDVAGKAIEMLDEWEIVSLHGRMMWPKSPSFEQLGERWVIPDERIISRAMPDQKYPRRRRITRTVKARLACGSLAYVVNRDAAQRLIDWKYDGFALDILIVDKFKACVCDPSPFNHPAGGSLVNTVTG